MNKFMIRTLTSIVFVIVLVGSILWSQASYAVLFSVITAMTVWEFCSIVNKNANLQVNRFITTVAGTYLFLAVLSFNLNVCGSEIFIPYIISIIYLLVSELYFDRQNSIYNWAFALMAQLYIALPLASINTLAFISLPQPYSVPSVVYVPMLVLSVFIFLWCNDAGAYCVGSLIGKHKLFPRISPGKSWEGCIGGAVFVLAAAYLIGEYIDMGILNTLQWLGLGLVVVVFGTWGDLVESLFKRTLGIKDSGNILPGHGGMLDRFDSSLLAIPAAVIYLYTVSLF
jgi:phosphatidate cytidylyltransferase